MKTLNKVQYPAPHITYLFEINTYYLNIPFMFYSIHTGNHDSNDLKKKIS